MQREFDGGPLVASTTNTANYVDLNGDGYPDPILGDQVFLTGPNGLPRQDWLSAETISGAAKSSSFSQLGLSGNIGGSGSTTAIQSPTTTSTADTTVAKAVGPEAALGAGVSLTFSRGISKPKGDLVNIVGDGLPAAVQFGGGGLRVSLNIGTKFLAGIPLASPIDVGGQAQSGGLGLVMGWKDPSGAFGGGASLTRSNYMDRGVLVDVNGDGLPDLVKMDADSNGSVRSLSVAFNNGWGFAPAVEIPVGDFAFPDAGVTETTIASIGAHLAYYPGPLCWPTPFCFLPINPAFSTQLN